MHPNEINFVNAERTGPNLEVLGPILTEAEVSGKKYVAAVVEQIRRQKQFYNIEVQS